VELRGQTFICLEIVVSVKARSFYANAFIRHGLLKKFGFEAFKEYRIR
jgi:hypothetical protein